MDDQYVAGRNAVLETIKSGREINKLWISEGAQKGSIQKIIQAAKERQIVIQYVPRKKLDEMAKNHQGVIAQIAPYRYYDVDDLFKKAEQNKEAPFFLILDEIEDPHNFGSLMRTADAAGVHGIIIPKRRSVGLTTTVAKASTGAIEYVPVARVTNLARSIDELKERGVWICGTDAGADTDYRELDGTLPIAIVIGSEGKGISRLIKEKCDFLVKLPMKGHVTSLNASVAGALLMYEVYRKRDTAGR